MSWKVLLILLLVYIILVLLGGAVFHFVELPTEDVVRIDTRNLMENFFANNPCVNRTKMEVFLKGVLQAYDAGVVATGNASSPSKWDYPAAIFFANTVITTIGYGHISPATVGGRIFCVFFALVGIPLTAIILGGIGEKMNNGLKKLQDKFEDCATKKNNVACHVLVVILIFLFGFAVFMLIPAGIFVAMEQWSYYESLYYAFITLTTIGFGDYVAGQDAAAQHRVWYRLFLWLWIVVGLSWLATMISRLQEMIQNPVSKVESSLSKEKSEKDSEEAELEEPKNSGTVSPEKL